MTERATIFYCEKALMPVPNIAQVSGRCDVPAGIVEQEVGVTLERCNTRGISLEADHGREHV